VEEIRINKYIASCGVCSRRNSEEFILSGRVRINGQVVTELGAKVKDEDIVEVDDKRIYPEQEKRYIMLNKPRGYVTTSKEQFDRPSVLDLLDVKQRVFAVGRLDMDSEGLLLLTNDGAFANKIIHPAKHIAKTYEVLLKKAISSENIEKLKQGVDIGGYVTRPAIVEKINDKNIIITIYEGKNRQVRKMCEAVDNKVINLRRVAIGKLKLGELEIGKYKYLTEYEIKEIFE